MYLLDKYKKGKVLDFHNQIEVAFDRDVSINKTGIKLTEIGNAIRNAKYNNCFISAEKIWNSLKPIILENKYDKIFNISNRDSKSILMSFLTKQIKENDSYVSISEAFKWDNYDFFKKGIEKLEIENKTKRICKISDDKCKIAILDDTYYSGSTLYLAFCILKKEYPNADFHLLCLTKVKSSDKKEEYFDKNAVEQCV